MKESLTYQKMLEEVETIVRDVASPQLDLDDMVQKVERGYALIQTMRQRLDQTKERIDELHQKYSETKS